MFGEAVPVLHPILYQVAALVVGFFFVFSGIFMACEREGFGDFCFSVHDRVDKIGHRFFTNHHGRHLVGIGFPVLMSGCLCYVINFLFLSVRTTVPPATFGTRSSLLYRRWTRLMQGDWPVHSLAVLFVVLPCVIKVFVPIVSFYRNGSHIEGARDDPSIDGFLSAIANPAGYAAVIAMSWFMVPVSRQSPILVALGWNPVQALKIHVWAGRTCIVFTVVHSLCFILIAWRTSQIRLVDIVFPRRDCWRQYGPAEFDRDADWPRCYLNFFLFTGFLSFLCISVLSFTALYWFRRAYYSTFYVCHIVFGSLGVIFMVMHWGEVILYIGPGFLYYFACTSPVLVQALVNYCRGGVKLRYTKLVSNAGFCAEMVFAKSAQARLADADTSAQYVRICVPELSVVWHPFTIATAPDDPSHLRLVFRRYGKFTTALYKRLQRTERPPTILIDAYYQGPDWAAQALRHDKVLMVTGGIGVTPFMSTIRQLLLELHRSYLPGESVTRRVEFHWTCRDIGLIKHILETHLLPLINQCIGASRGRRRRKANRRRRLSSKRALSSQDSQRLVGDDDDDDNEDGFDEEDPDQDQDESECRFDMIVHYTKGRGSADFILSDLRESHIHRLENSGRSVFGHSSMTSTTSTSFRDFSFRASMAPSARLPVPQDADDDAMGPDGQPLIYHDKEPKEDMYFHYAKDKGVEMDPAHFAMNANYGFLGNAPSMLLFYLVICTGIYCMWRIFVDFGEVHYLVVSLNAYPLYTIFAISLAVAIPFELVRVGITKDPFRTWASNLSGYDIEDAANTNRNGIYSTVETAPAGTVSSASTSGAARGKAVGLSSASSGGKAGGGGPSESVKGTEHVMSDSSSDEGNGDDDDDDDDSYSSFLGGEEDCKLGMVVGANDEPPSVPTLSASAGSGSARDQVANALRSRNNSQDGMLGLNASLMDQPQQQAPEEVTDAKENGNHNKDKKPSSRPKQQQQQQQHGSLSRSNTRTSSSLMTPSISATTHSIVHDDFELGEDIRVSDNLTVSLSLRGGRPNFDQVVGSLEGGELPAVFYCGPDSVLKLIKKAVREQMGRFPKWKCAFYEEEFYM